MTTKYVKYCSYLKLPCALLVLPDVVLCLQSSELVVQPELACSLPSTFINAQICQAYTLSDPCSNPLWQYRFQYDDTQLTNPEVNLQAGDITGVFCKDCLTDWIEENLSCSLELSVITVTTTYTVAASQIILADATAAGFTISLPAAATMAGRQYSIKKVDSSGNVVTIDPNGSETIDGATTKTLTTQYQTITIVCNGTAWYII